MVFPIVGYDKAEPDDLPINGVCGLRSLDGLSLVVPPGQAGDGGGRLVPAEGPLLSEQLILDPHLGVEDGGGDEVTLLHVLHVLQYPPGGIAGH